MKTEVKTGDGLVREIRVELPQDTVKAETERKFAEVRRTAEIKGFRKGKAPMDRIKAMYGEAVQADVMEDLIKNSYPEAIRDGELRPAAMPQVTKAGYTDDGGFEYTAEVEVFPEIESIITEGLVVTVPKVEVKDSDVDDFIKNMLEQTAETNPVEREATDRDVVLADVVKVEDTKGVIEGDKFPDQQIDLSNVNTVKEFRAEIPGLKAGEEKEVAVSYPEDYPDKKFAGATIKYRLEIKTVMEKIVPEFNDAYAKASGQAETALEMRLKVREELENRVKEEHERRKRGLIIGQVCEKNDFPVPKAMVDRYLQSVVEDFQKRYPESSEEEIRNNYQDVGVKTVRWNLLYNRLAELEKIEVLPSDTEKRIKRFADNYSMTVEQAKQALQQAGNIEDIRDSILEEKVLDYLAERTEIVFAEPPKE